jgi:hypothetical protein
MKGGKAMRRAIVMVWLVSPNRVTTLWLIASFGETEEMSRWQAVVPWQMLSYELRHLLAARLNDGYSSANRVIILFPSVGNEADRIAAA